VKRADKIPTFEQFISEEEHRIAGDDDDDDLDFLYEPRTLTVCGFIARATRDTFGEPSRKRRERLVEIEIEVIPDLVIEIESAPESLRAA
jgi:hypothetical protein